MQQDLMLHKPIVSEFIINAPKNFFVVAMTSYYNDFVVIITNFSVVISIFSCSVGFSLFATYVTSC